MTRHLLTLGVVLAVAGTAAAQYGGGAYAQPYNPAQQPGNALPNYYNRTTQPLSPYLNLLGGGNPALNYYYGVRPGLTNGGMSPAQQYGRQPTSPGGFGPGGTTYLPPSSFTVPDVADPTQPPGESFTLPSAGGGKVYGNLFGSSRTGVPGSGGAGGLGTGATGPRQVAGGNRPATGGTSGTTPGTIPKSR